MAVEENCYWESRVAIIGGGISGIAAAKQLYLYDPVVFEASDSIGGVWKHCSYRSTRLQTPRRDYEFSDYPWPEPHDESFPTHIEIVEYLIGYATHFDVLKFVKFNSKVVEIRFLGSNQFLEQYSRPLTGRPVWEVGVKRKGSDDVQWYPFEFLVMSIGKYGDIPRLLAFPLDKGPEVFRGKVMHSLDYCKLNPEATERLMKGKKVVVVGYKKSAIDLAVECAEANREYSSKAEVKRKDEGFSLICNIITKRNMNQIISNKLMTPKATERLMKGKKVVVVGYKKSAIDLAVECAEANRGPAEQPCTMLIRTLHWTVPSYRIWGLPFFLFYSTRTSQFLHERPNQSFLRDLFSLLSSPLRRAVSRLIESYLVWKLPLKKYGLVPDHPFEEDYASCQMAILPENFFSEAEQGRILFKKSPKKWWFYDGGIELEDNTRLEADVVMLATGFEGKSKLKSILPEPFRDLIENSSGIMPLYRSTIHPLIPNMAFVGYVESVSNLHSAELRCKWLARLLDNHFTLPNVERMLKQTTEEMEVMKRTTRFYKRNCISTFSINHSDEICEEMGWNSWRKSNWFSEAFSPYSNRDYREDDKGSMVFSIMKSWLAG